MNDVELLSRCLLLENQVKTERDNVERWRESANKYWDIRNWLRVCEDTPAGHALFYRECCLLIFGEYQGETEDDTDD